MIARVKSPYAQVKAPEVCAATFNHYSVLLPRQQGAAKKCKEALRCPLLSWPHRGVVVERSGAKFGPWPLLTSNGTRGEHDRVFFSLPVAAP